MLQKIAIYIKNISIHNIYICTYSYIYTNLNQLFKENVTFIFTLNNYPVELLLNVWLFLFLKRTPCSFLEKSPASGWTYLQEFFIQTVFDCPPCITLPWIGVRNKPFIGLLITWHQIVCWLRLQQLSHHFLLLHTPVLLFRSLKSTSYFLQ